MKSARRFSRGLPRRSLEFSRSPHGQRIITAVLVLLVLLATVAVAGALYLESPEMTPRQQARDVSYRYCPEPSCTAYPDPANVRGITIATLQNWVLYIKAAEAEIRAAGAWNANTVRLQIVQDKMVGAGGRSLSSRYHRAVTKIVHYALHRGLDVVLNAQTEISMGFVRNEPLPTRATYAFWRSFIPQYGHNPRVVFDLFNEPRDEQDGLCDWSTWKQAFQPLVNYVRSAGSRNQLWVEGCDWGSTLAGVPLLAGQGIVYSYHHPGSPWPYGPQRPWLPRTGPATWTAAFGYLAAGGVPVVNGEFANFMGGYYWNHGTAQVTRYFTYLHYHHIGTVAWSLQPGIMTATSTMTTAVSEPQGAGRLFWRYFHGTLGRRSPVTALAAGEGSAPVWPARRLGGVLAAGR